MGMVTKAMRMGWLLEDTGGGCTAFRSSVGHGCLMTSVHDALRPTSMNEDCVLCEDDGRGQPFARGPASALFKFNELPEDLACAIMRAAVNRHE